MIYIKGLLTILSLLLVHLICYSQSSELNQIKSSLSSINDSMRYTDALNRMAMLLYEKNLDSTFYYTVRARGIADRINYSKGKADAINNLGVFFDLKGNLQLALRYYSEAYIGYTNLDDVSNRVQSLMNIAMVYQESGKDNRAIMQYRSALNLGTKLKKDSILSLAIYNYILQYPSQISKDSLPIYLSKARAIATKYRDERTLLALDQLSANNLLAQGHHSEGVALLKKSIDTAISKKLYYVTMDMLCGLGDHLAKTDSAAAVATYRHGLEISAKKGYLLYSILMSRKLFDLYTEHGDVRSAAIYSRQLINYSDVREKLNNESKIDYLDYALKDRQVNSLVAQSKYKNALIILFIIICLLAASVIISIRRHLKNSKLLNEKISLQNSQMKSTLRALEQSQADNTRMMQIVAHDLRNPIGGIHSLAILLLDDITCKYDDRLMLEMIKTSAGHSLELVNDLLQVNNSQDELKKEPVEISEMLSYCVSLSMNKAEAKRQRITLNSVPLILSASREKLWRVVSNLIGNAIKFSPFETVIEVTMQLSASSVLIAVKDQGIGIPVDMHDVIFDMFTKAKRQGTAGEQAFGLGLAISKQILEAHNGKIWFTSIPGKGTTFFVELPVVQDQPTAIS